LSQSKISRFDVLPRILLSPLVFQNPDPKQMSLLFMKTAYILRVVLPTSHHG